MPDCGRSGATITNSPKGATASMRARMPGAWMPSSLQTNIRGLSKIFFLQSYGILAAARMLLVALSETFNIYFIFDAAGAR
jgi:hypothetical protein